jgi:hypothetical protein
MQEAKKTSNKKRGTSKKCKGLKRSPMIKDALLKKCTGSDKKETLLKHKGLKKNLR